MLDTSKGAFDPLMHYIMLNRAGVIHPFGLYLICRYSAFGHLIYKADTSIMYVLLRTHCKILFLIQLHRYHVLQSTIKGKYVDELHSSFCLFTFSNFLCVHYSYVNKDGFKTFVKIYTH